MTKNRKLSALGILLLIAAVVMILVGGIGVTRAVLTQSDTHNATLSMKNIDITLVENKTDVADDGELLADLLGDDASFKVGKKYDEVLTVRNDGAIDAYVRVILYRYWTDGEVKSTDLDPSLIRLGLGAGWKVDDASSTPERTVLYYTKPLAAGDTSDPVLENISIADELLNMVTQTRTTAEDGTVTVTNEYTYNDLSFALKAEVDAVQTHNADDAIKSAWGQDKSALGLE